MSDTKVRTESEARNFFLRNHKDSVTCVGDDGAEYLADSYPEAVAFLGGERDPDALALAGE